MLGGTCDYCPRRPDYPLRCIEPAPVAWRDDAEGVEGETCPVLLTQTEHEWLRAWAMFERGVLPRAGGWAEQDAAWVQAMEAVEPAVAKARADREEQLRAAIGDPE